MNTLVHSLCHFCESGNPWFSWILCTTAFTGMPSKKFLGHTAAYPNQGGLRQQLRKILLGTVMVCALLPDTAVSQWYVHYQDGLKQLDQGQWREAAQSLRQAINQKQTPELNANTYALVYIDYLPYYHLGRALFFQGDYAGAIENFNRSLAHGVIKRSQHNKALLRLLEIAEAMQAQSQHSGTKSAVRTEAWIAMLRLSHELGQGLARNESEIDSVLAQSHLDDETQKQIVRWFGQLLRAGPVAPANSRAASARPTGQAETAGDSASILKNAAITAYLQGRYRDALHLFDQLAQRAPAEPALADWQQRVRFELARLDQLAVEPLAKTDTVTVERSAAPMISILEPRPEESRFRNEKLRLAGVANDDVGIAAIEVVVNGEPLKFENDAAQLHPARHANGTYPFVVDIPLRMNENQIAVTARDLDQSPHSRTELRQFFRQPPLHHTPAFWLVAGSGLLVVAGAVVANRLIRYRITFVNRYNPYIAGAPIRNEEMFFGRQLLLDRILRTLPNNSMMVYGPRRIGKTSVQYQLQRLLRERQDPEFHFAPVFIDLQGTPEDLFFAHIIEEVREQLGEEVAQAIAVPVNRRAYGPRELANDLRTVINKLQEQLARDNRENGKKVRLVFLIDEVDELNRYSERTNQRLRAIFMKTFSENLVAVMTGSNLRKQWESESSPWYNFFEQVPMPTLTREEAMQLIHDPVKGFFKFEATAAEKIWEASQGKPFVIQKFCVRLVNLAIEKRRRTILPADVESTRNEVLQDTSGQTQEVAVKLDMQYSNDKT